MDKALLICSLLVFTFCTTSDGSKTTLDLLPRDNDIEGWSRDKARTDQAFDQNSLYDIIDGGAEDYLRYGFEEGGFAVYQNANKQYEIDVQIYRQDNAANAKLLYDFLLLGTFTAIDDETRSAEGFGNVVIEALRDRYFIRVTASTLSTSEYEEGKVVLSAFVELIEKSIK